MSPHSCVRFRWIVAVAVLTILAVPAQLRAITISVGDDAARSPSSGANNFLDVLLTNDGVNILIIGAFSFGLSVPDPHIAFTSVSTAQVSPSPYIFAGQSTFGPDIATTAGQQTVVASDLFAIPFFGRIVSAGETVGLGRVFYTVSAGAPPGLVPVTLIAADTSVADLFGNDVPVDTLEAGSITIVPEPSSFLLLTTAIGPLALATGRFRKK